MAVLPILITGDPVLHTAAQPVVAFDAELRTLADDMFETMAAAPGVGLAAPQVGVALRMFVYSWAEDDVLWRGVAVNPELWMASTPVGEPDEETEAEGCLSIPSERFALRRAPRAILRAVDLAQQPFEVRAEGWLARIFQHEYDHLDGVLYADRLGHDEAKLAAKAIRKHRWGAPGGSWLPGRDHLESSDG